jgi:hypothetical protein
MILTPTATHRAIRRAMLPSVPAPSWHASEWNHRNSKLHLYLRKAMTAGPLRLVMAGGGHERKGQSCKLRDVREGIETRVSAQIVRSCCELDDCVSNASASVL